jgi:hypothetical protein
MDLAFTSFLTHIAIHVKIRSSGSFSKWFETIYARVGSVWRPYAALAQLCMSVLMCDDYIHDGAA